MSKKRIGTDGNGGGGEKTMTNGDRIRAMTNEELAEKLNEFAGCPPDKEEMPCNHIKCLQCWINWMNTEVVE